MRRIVLVVDDDAGVRALHRRLLAQRGYDVIEASDTAEAITGLASNPVAMVLDVDMRGARRLLDRLAGRRGSPPVVLCASNVRAARIARRYHVGALSKFALEAIADEVERIVVESQRPRLSRVSAPTASRPSFA